MSFGHALKTSGRQSEQSRPIAQHRARPEFGEAYWSLANLKTFRFAPAEVDAMLAQLQRADFPMTTGCISTSRWARPWRTPADTKRSFEHYAGNDCAASADYDAEETAAHVRRSRALYTREFFAAHFGSGCAGARSDLHRRIAAVRIDAPGADPCESFRGRRHDGTAGHNQHCA